MQTSRIGLLALVLTLAGCTATAGPSGPDPNRPLTLAGTAWKVVSVGGRVPVAGAEPTLEFGATSVGGSAGCNQFGGSYQYDAASGQLTLSNLAMTAMACEDKRRMDLEAAFNQALGVANLVTTDDAGRLVLGGPGGAILAIGDKAAAG